MKRLLTLGVLSALLISQSGGQDTPRATFHTTSVRSADATDYCGNGKCLAMRFTVEGYIEAKGSTLAVEYVLTCVEFRSTEPPAQITIACDRVHAHEDYTVKLGADYVVFGGEQQLPKQGPPISAYSIVSEKEVARHGR
jgi:hypothetical protein